MKEKIAFWPAILWGGIILVLSILPTSSLEKINWSDIINLDKLGHLLAYAVFTILLALGFYFRQHKKFIFKAVLIAIGYGALMELLQYSRLSDRYFEILDLIANIIGSIIGSAIIYYKLKK